MTDSSVLCLPALMQPQPKTPSQDLHPLVSTLAATMRAAWQKLPELEPLSTVKDLRAIHGELDGETLFIGNELYQCRGFRKIHLEIAKLGNGLQILHCVWFPDPRFDLPIFGADIVAGPAGISAAIVDLSPTSSQLPDPILENLEAIEIPAFRQVRDLPGWGTIFSSKVCLSGLMGMRKRICLIKSYRITSRFSPIAQLRRFPNRVRLFLRSTGTRAN